MKKQKTPTMKNFQLKKTRSDPNWLVKIDDGDYVFIDDLDESLDIVREDYEEDDSLEDEDDYV